MRFDCKGFGLARPQVSNARDWEAGGWPLALRCFVRGVWRSEVMNAAKGDTRGSDVSGSAAWGLVLRTINRRMVLLMSQVVLRSSGSLSPTRCDDRTYGDV